MPAPATTESALSWDFTQVLDLIRSSTYDMKEKYAQQAALYASPSSEGHSTHDLTPNASSRPDEIKPRRSYPKLGEFGLVWDLLSKDSPSPKNDAVPEDSPLPSVDRLSTLTILKRPVHDEPAKVTISTPHRSVPVQKVEKPPVAKETNSNRSSRSPSSPSQHSVSILKRATSSYPTKSDVTATSPPQTPPRVIVSPSKPTEIPKINNRTKATPKLTKRHVNPEPMLSENSTGLDSDSSPVVFDQPITKKSGVLAFVPTQGGSRDARSYHEDTPPSSYEEADWTLSSNFAQNIITTSAGIQVLPAAYKTATERRIGLMTRLLRDFPEYAQLVSQVGRSPTLTKKSAEPQPIHVFVDMSNVCFLPVLNCHPLLKLIILP
jgi:hypothetical protein